MQSITALWLTSASAPFATACGLCGCRVIGEQAERARQAHRPLVICDRCVVEAPEARVEERRAA